MGDIPAIIIKECAHYICVPVRYIINKSIISGHWARIYKKETITPIPKVYHPDTVDLLRPIANLFNMNKIQEMVMEDM